MALNNGIRFNGSIKTVLLFITLAGYPVIFGIQWGSLNERLASMEKLQEERYVSMYERLKYIEDRVDDRYKGSDAREDFAVRDKRLDRLEAKLDEIFKEGQD